MHLGLQPQISKKTSYKPLDQIVRKTQEEEIGSEEDNSSYFKDVWSFNHPHMSMKERWEKLCQVEIPVEKGTFRAFQKKE